MASSDTTVLLKDTALAASTTEAARELNREDKELFAELVVASSDATVDVTLEHSSDGATWYQLVAFGSIVAAPGTELVSLSGALKFVRADVTLTGGAPLVDIDVKIHKGR